MTVSYHLDIATTGPFAFFKVLFRWKASIWKRTLVDMITWVAVYSLISVLYRLVLFDRGQMYLEKLAPYLDTRLVFFPVDFILGFFVIIVFKRWEGIFNNIGFIDNCALNVSAYIPGDDPKIIILRRNILRYICLSQVLVLRDVSVSVKLRFPNMAAVEDAGYLQNKELDILMRNGQGFDKKYWLPLIWANQLIMKLSAEQRIASQTFVLFLSKSISEFQTNLRTLLSYDWLPIPLSYTQAVFVLVRISMCMCLFARQSLLQHKGLNFGLVLQNDEEHQKTDDDKIDLVVPFMTLLQVFFYLAWIKVGEEMLNPLGGGESDFEINYIIDRNLSFAMLMADSFAGKFPKQLPDTLLPLHSKAVENIYAGSVSMISQLKALAMHLSHNSSATVQYSEKDLIQLSKLTKLETLALGDFKPLTDEALKVIIDSNPALAILELPYCHQISDSTLTNVLQNCQNLNSFTICHIPKLTKVMINHLCEQLSARFGQKQTIWKTTKKEKFLLSCCPNQISKQEIEKHDYHYLKIEHHGLVEKVTLTCDKCVTF